MKLLDVIAQANSNLLRSKARTALTILAIFIGSFTIILNSAINAGVNSFIDKQVESFGGDGYIELMPIAFEEQMQSMMGGGSAPSEYNPEKNSSALNYISDQSIEKIKQIDGIIPDSVKKLTTTSSEYITSAQSTKKYKLTTQALPSDSINIDMLYGRNVDLNSNEPEIALIEGYGSVLGFASDDAIVGQKVTIAVKNIVNGEISQLSATVSGIQAPSIISFGRNWINDALNTQIHELASFGLPTDYANQSVFATAKYDPNLPKEKVEQIKSELAELQIAASTVDDQVGMVRTFFDVVLIVFSIFGAIALLAAAIGIINTLLMSVSDRTREIGLMKAMGLSNFKVFLSFALEATLLGFWSSLFGTAVAMLVGFAANNAFHAEGMFLADFPTFSLVEFTPNNIISIFVLIMGIAFVAGTIPAIYASRKNPIDALRYE